MLSTANNLDLVLWGRRVGSSNDEIVYVAEGLHETNEGFDVVLPDDFSTLSASLIGPTTLAGCVDANGAPTTGEPHWWWTMWGVP